MPFSRCALAALTALAVVLAPHHALRAQTAASPTPDSTRRALILVNPFSFLFPGVSGEAEFVVAPSATVAFGGSYYGNDGPNYSTATVKLRLYPQEHAPAGFAVALGAGLARQQESYCDFGCGRRSKTHPSVGVELDYTWLLGPTRHFGLSLGGGLQRVLGIDERNDSFDQFLPMGRLGIGYAF